MTKHDDGGPGISRAKKLEELGKELSCLLAEARAFANETAALFDPPLSSTGFQVVQWLHAAGATRSTHIAAGLAMDRSALSRSLKQLEQAGLLAAHADPLDARATVYALTPSARSRMNQALVNKGARYEQRLATWTAAEIGTLTGLLRKLNGGEPGR
jgi:DNA-binding MarR family transcriptional regulator